MSVLEQIEPEVQSVAVAEELLCSSLGAHLVFVLFTASRSKSFAFNTSFIPL